MIRLAIAALVFCFAATAQVKLSVSQINSFIKSSIQLKHDDRRVAEYLKKVELTEKLTDRDIEELQGLGAGPKTVAALHELRDNRRHPIVLTVSPPVLDRHASSFNIASFAQALNALAEDDLLSPYDALFKIDSS